MTALDIHAERHRLKQLTDDGDGTLFENRDGVDCPACGAQFVRMFATTRRTVSFPENDGSRFCFVRSDETVQLFRH
ncbi:MAG: flagella cluster protein [Natronomonas sp.]|jgi:hypothetical protein|uniref:Flagella cluster protein n=1 Tax=Natronomonas salsuginis TaxID=2217661 RepID=A0A4U5JGE4_9EURY|nr:MULTISPECIES: flagella cluster protein [Natronomonas]MDR9380096.1 flagella cluster protein [Natronomonas sp.]MDR9429259.1 flagella cluster protein [Natronomonas sp.]TKR28304.1 flagella cluster protein [Natronomonas salsuginis]